MQALVEVEKTTPVRLVNDDTWLVKSSKGDGDYVVMIYKDKDGNVVKDKDGKEVKTVWRHREFDPQPS